MNNSFQNTETGIRIKNPFGTIGEVSNLHYLNSTMTDVQTPIEISTYYPESIIPKPSGERYPSGASLIAHNIYVDSPVASKNATLIVAVSTKSLLHSSSKQYFN